jgi:CHAT domain-containing protein
VVFAGPDYDAKPGQRQARASELLRRERITPGAGLRSSPAVDTRGLRWSPLPGAAAEAADVVMALKDVRYRPVTTYVGADALEEVFKAIEPPRILHVATHGFFLPDPKVDADAAGADADARGAPATGLARLRHLSNPLLRSGLVLAGANTAQEAAGAASADDGYVTAEEIALMNLRGTELVVLSACETGLGDVRAGGGVYGLRHAFLYAGARTLVTSLFEVPDAETRALMKRFYEALDAGRGKLEALHAAQLGLLEERRRAHDAAHPFFWASFVMVGDAR